MVAFKTPQKSLKTIFESIKNSPKVACSRCGAIYIGKQQGFICFDCMEKLREEKIRNEYECHRRKVLLDKSNIPRRQRVAILKAKTDTQRKVINYFIENFTKKPLEQSSDILLFGTVGTGKTYLSCAFAIELINRRAIEVKYITEYDLLDAFFRKEYQKFDLFKKSQILILDELGKRELAEWQRVQLEELLSYRFNEMLPTIYISNLTENRFKEFIGERLTDRLKESNIARFSMVGDSLRGGGYLGF